MLIVCPNCATGYEVNAETIGDSGRTVRCSFCRKQWFEPARLLQNASVASAPEFASLQPAAPIDMPAPDQPMPDQHAPTAPDQTPAEENIESLWDVPQAPSPPLAPASDPIADTLSSAPAKIDTPQGPPGWRALWRLDRRELQLAPILIALQFAVICAGLLWRNEIVYLLPQTASFFRATGLDVNTRGLVFADLRISRDSHDGITVLIVEGAIVNTVRSAVPVPRLRFALRNPASAELVSWTTPPEKSSLRAGETMPFRSRLVSPPAGGSDIVVRFLNRQDFVSGAR